MSSDKRPSSSGQEDQPKVGWQWGGDEMKIDRSQGPKQSELKSSRAYSVATPAMDKSRRNPLRAENPGSIPTAGGKALGGLAREEREKDRERRKSRMSGDMGSPPPVGEQLNDPFAPKDTQATTIPPEVSNGEGSSKVEDRALSDPAPDVVVSDADGKVDNPTTTDASATPVANQVADENPAVTVLKENEEAPPVKERRGSRLDDMLGKLKFGKKKDKLDKTEE